MQSNETARVLEKLPPQSRAAAAQRLDERPLPAIRGHYYDVPHLPLHPRGWYLRRHLKRKNLHRSNQQYTVVERVGTHFSLLPLAFAILVLIVVAGMLFVVFPAFSAGAHTRVAGVIFTVAAVMAPTNRRVSPAQKTTRHVA